VTLGLLVAVLVTAGQSGCTRRFYRKQADEVVANILDGKNCDPRWDIQQYHVYPDPRARFADPNDPDRPPMPPDDPAAPGNQQLSRCEPLRDRTGVQAIPPARAAPRTGRVQARVPGAQPEEDVQFARHLRGMQGPTRP